MRSPCLRPASAGLLLFALCAASAWGQSTGRLTGVVKDQSGGTVEGARVSLYRPDGTEPELQTRTTSAGIFNFDAVSPLTYRLVVEKQGFSSFEITDVKVSPGVELPLNGIVLPVSQAQAVVETAAKAEGVGASGAEVSTTLRTEQLQPPA